MNWRIVFLGVCVAATGCARSSQMPQAPARRPDRLSRPVIFERNDGQAPAEYRFISRGPALDVGFAPGAVMLSVKDRHVALRFEGASQAVVSGDAPRSAYVNYLRGRDAGRWQTHVPTFERVRYAQLYHGIDAVFYIADRTLEYDLTVAPYADPSVIALRFSGADRVAADAGGDLVVTAGGRDIVQHKPVAYQDANGRRVPIEAAYRISDNRVTLALGPYDLSRPLTIDPVIASSSLIGGSQIDDINGVAVDAAGAVYVAGETSSPNLPSATNARHGAVDDDDAFVCKLSEGSRSIIYCTYLGGTSMDLGTGVAVDSSGHAYVSGSTSSTEFPVTPGAFRTTCPCLQGSDGFVAKLAPDGASLVYSTFLGGSQTEFLRGIAVDGSGRAHVAGSTISADFPVTPGAPGQHFRGGFDAFVTTLSADGTSLVFSTFLGGSGMDAAVAVAVDGAGNTYVAGSTSSSDLPVTAALQPSLTIVPGNTFNQDGFFAKFNASGTLIVCSYFGGGNSDAVNAIAADATGVYLAGETESPTLPPMASGSAPRLLAAFVSQLTPDAMHAKATRFFDGDSVDSAIGLAIDGRNVHVAGFTFSMDFPTTADAPEPVPVTAPGQQPLDAFYMILPIGSDGMLQTTPRFSTLIGGKASNHGNAMAQDRAGGAWIVGTTDGSDFPAVNAAGRFVANFVVSGDGFVTHFMADSKFVTTTAGDIVLWATDASRVQGQWALVADASAAGGRRLANTDAGAAKVTTPAAAPAHFIEFTFGADAGTAYHLWIRGKAQKDSANNDSVYAQFSDSVDASGNPIWRIGTSSAAPIIIEDCTNCGLKGWGWNDNAYGVGVSAQLVRFASGGQHTIRFQPREDGLSIDQVVLSSTTYRDNPPGGPKDTTIVLGRSTAAAQPPPSDNCTVGETVIYAATATRASGWNVTTDATAAGGARLSNADAGAPKLSAPQPTAASFDLDFQADSNTDYRLWIRGKALNDFWGNDSVFVQFSDSIDAAGASIWRINSTSATSVNLEDCSGCGLKSWGWQDNGWGVGVMGPVVRFGTRGMHTIHVSTREDGFSIDQIVLSSGKYLNAAPGALKNDATILPECTSPPLR